MVGKMEKTSACMRKLMLLVPLYMTPNTYPIFLKVCHINYRLCRGWKSLTMVLNCCTMIQR